MYGSVCLDKQISRVQRFKKYQNMLSKDNEELLTHNHVIWKGSHNTTYRLTDLRLLTTYWLRWSSKYHQNIPTMLKYGVIWTQAFWLGDFQNANFSESKTSLPLFVSIVFWIVKRYMITALLLLPRHSHSGILRVMLMLCDPMWFYVMLCDTGLMKTTAWRSVAHSRATSEGCQFMANFSQQKWPTKHVSSNQQCASGDFKKENWRWVRRGCPACKIFLIPSFDGHLPRSVFKCSRAPLQKHYQLHLNCAYRTCHPCEVPSPDVAVASCCWHLYAS